MADNNKVEKKAGFSVTKWFREMKSELKKVVWPTWRQVAKNTGIVIAMILIVGAFLALVSVPLQAGVQALIAL